MKSNKNQDSTKISELLKSLRASYLGSDKKSTQRKEKSDGSDKELEGKLRQALATLSDNTAKKPKKTRVTPSPAPLVEGPTEEFSREELIEEDPIATEVFAEEAFEEASQIEEAAPEANPAPKKKATRTRAPKKSTAKPPVAPTVAEGVLEESPDRAAEPIDEPVEEIYGAPLANELPEKIVEEEIVEELPTRESPMVTLPRTSPDAPDFRTEEAKERDSIPLRLKIKATPTEAIADSEALTEAEKSKQSCEDRVIFIKPSSAFEKKPEPSAPSDSIVIRPKGESTSYGESIVIRPKGQDPATPVRRPTQEKEAEPILIGKKVDSDRNETAKGTPTRDGERTGRRTPGVTSVSADSVFAIKKEEADKASAPKSRVKVRGVVESRPIVTAHEPILTEEDALKKKSPFGKKKKQKEAPANEIPSPKAEEAETEQPSLNEELDEVLDDVLVEEAVEEASFDAPTANKGRSGRKRRHEEQLPVMEAIRKRTGMTEDDLTLIFELGYENELGRVIGHDNLRRLKVEYLRRSSHSYRTQDGTAFGYRGAEYDGSQEKDTILAAYHHDRKQLLLRTLLTAFISLLLLFCDVPTLIGGSLLSASGAYPLLLPIVGLVLLVGCAALSYRQLDTGLRQFFKLSPTPYSVAAILVPFSLLYSVLSLLSDAEMLRIGFLTSLSLLVTCLCDVLRLFCECRVFRLVAAEGVKTVLESAEPRKKKLRRGDKIVKIIDDDADKRFYRIRTAEQTVGFFRRFNSMNTATRPFSILLVAMLSLATVFALTNTVYTSSVAAGLSSFMTVLLLSAPLSAIVSFFYPICRANRLLTHYNCALLGAEGAEELDDRKTVILEDIQLLTAKSRTEILVREGDDFRRDLRLCRALLLELGGTLGQIVDAVPMEVDTPVSIIRVAEGGVEAMAENRYHILMGCDTFLRRNGIRIPKESTDERLSREKNVSRMYVAVDGRLTLTYEIEYTLDEKAEQIISDLAFHGTVVGIHTYDPNLTEGFLQSMRPENADPVRIIKSGRYEEEVPLELVDTAAISLGDPLRVVSVLHAAAGIGRCYRFGMRIQLIASLLGASLAVALTLLGRTSFLGVLPIAGYQLFWSLLSVLTTQTELNRGTLRLKK